MNNSQIRFTIKFFVSLIALGLLLLFIYGHRPDFSTVGQKYLYIFKDSIQYKIDENPASWVGRHDNLVHFIYYDSIKDKRDYYEVDDTTYNNYYIAVWNFESLNNYSLNEVYINSSSHIEITSYLYGETLDPDGYCPTTVKFLYDIDGLILNVSDDSKIIKEFSGENYKGFYGLLNKVSISNRKGAPQIYFNFKKSLTPTIFIIHSGSSGFHLIKINATKHLNEDIIKVFNLQ